MTADPGRVRRLNAAALLGVPMCLAAGGFELSRALGGNGLSWVYAVEWPFVAVYLLVIRRQLVREHRGFPAPAGRLRTGTASRRGTDPARDDPGLLAWQDYVARLHASQPPGGPPEAAPRPVLDGGPHGQ
ncbi:MAG: hypothetical protein M3Y71_16630 [Actinomycetota bacterium]|nr:hypothetical protein [Actinomycetota bacterium]